MAEGFAYNVGYYWTNVAGQAGAFTFVGNLPSYLSYTFAPSNQVSVRYMGDI